MVCVCLDETKCTFLAIDITGRFGEKGYKEKQLIPIVKYGYGSLVPWGCYAAGGEQWNL